MIKRGDFLFGFAIAIILLIITLLLLEYPLTLIMQIAIAGIVIEFVYALIAHYVFNRSVNPFDENPQVREIHALIQNAEEQLEEDIQKSIASYKQIKTHYSELHPHDKSRVLSDVMRLYLKLLERLHLKG